jgi:hypothetical protein
VVFPLDGLDVLCLEALGALGDRELYRLAFLQAPEDLTEALKQFPSEAKVYYEMGPNGPGTIGEAQYVKVWGDEEMGLLLKKIAQRSGFSGDGPLGLLPCSPRLLEGSRCPELQFLTARAGMLFLKPHEATVSHGQSPGGTDWIHLRLPGALQAGRHKTSSKSSEFSSSSSSSFEYPVASSTLGLSLGQPSSPIRKESSSFSTKTLSWWGNCATWSEARTGSSNNEDGSLLVGIIRRSFQIGDAD